MIYYKQPDLARTYAAPSPPSLASTIPTRPSTRIGTPAPFFSRTLSNDVPQKLVLIGSSRETGPSVVGTAVGETVGRKVGWGVTSSTLQVVSAKTQFAVLALVVGAPGGTTSDCPHPRNSPTRQSMFRRKTENSAVRYELGKWEGKARYIGERV